MKTASGDPYRIINLVFALIILFIFIYSWYYGLPGKVHPVPSVSGMLTGKSTISTGLSRSFSAIMHFRLNEARSFNPHGIGIFMFFLAQLIMRITGILLTGFLRKKAIVITDAVISFILFLFLFWPFLIYWLNAINP